MENKPLSLAAKKLLVDAFQKGTVTLDDKDHLDPAQELDDRDYCEWSAWNIVILNAAGKAAAQSLIGTWCFDQERITTGLKVEDLPDGLKRVWVRIFVDGVEVSPHHILTNTSDIVDAFLSGKTFGEI